LIASKSSPSWSAETLARHSVTARFETITRLFRHTNTRTDKWTIRQTNTHVPVASYMGYLGADCGKQATGNTLLPSSPIHSLSFSPLPAAKRPPNPARGLVSALPAGSGSESRLQTHFSIF